jgi:hypothetical protein
VITFVCQWLLTAPQHFVEDTQLAAKLFGWIEWNFREDRPVPYKKLLKAGRLLYVPPCEQQTAVAVVVESKPVAAAVVAVPSSPADKALAEKEALRAAVRARMAAQNAVLGDKGLRSSQQRKASVDLAPVPSLPVPSQQQQQQQQPSSSVAAPAAGSPSSGLTTSSQDLRSSVSGLSPSTSSSCSELSLPFGWTSGAHQDLFEVAPLEVARQITWLDFALFAKIPLRELHERGWLVHGGQACPNIMRAIGFFNHLSRAVATSVVRLKQVWFVLEEENMFKRCFVPAGFCSRFSCCVVAARGPGAARSQQLLFYGLRAGRARHERGLSPRAHLAAPRKTPSERTRKRSAAAGSWCLFVVLCVVWI